MLVLLRTVGIFNAAIWLGAGIFFTIGIAPASFTPEMKRVFGDYYVGVIAQNFIGRMFILNMICGGIALLHFFAEMIYAGRPFRKFTFALLAGLLSLSLLGGFVLTPKLKALHQIKHRGPAGQVPQAKVQFGQLHGLSMAGNLLSLLALILYTWQVTHPPDPTRFVGTPKFRG